MLIRIQAERQLAKLTFVNNPTSNIAQSKPTERNLRFEECNQKQIS